MSLGSMRVYTRLVVIIFFVQSLFFTDFLGSSHAASAFPFRNVRIGGKLPSFEITSMDGKEFSTYALKGHPAVFVFWGADIPVKEKRSIEALKAMEHLRPFLENKGIRMLSVDVQGDHQDVIEEVRTKAGSSLPVYLDPTREAYKTLGIFVMPSVLLVDNKGRIAAGMGYSHDLIPRLKGEVEVMLGEKTRKQVEEELNPKMVSKSPEETAALRHLNMGLVMARRGMADAAIEEIKKATELKKDMPQAYIELGCLYVESGKNKEGEKALERGLELAPDSVKGRICMAKAMAQGGDLDQAIGDITGLLFRNGNNPEIHYTLGCLYEKKGDFAMASREFKKAYELLKKFNLD